MSYAKPQIISEGTLRLQDLIPAIYDALMGLDNGDVKAEVQAIMEGIEFRDENDIFYKEDSGRVPEAVWVYHELDEIANSVAAPFCYFGAHEGDGSCIGWHVSMDTLNDAERYTEDVVKIAAGDKFPESDEHEFVMEVNDHGNVTLWQLDGGEFKKVWEVV